MGSGPHFMTDADLTGPASNSAIPYFRVALRLPFFLALRFTFDFFAFTRSGNSFDPVSRFHSSNVSAEISPFINSSANFLRCALLLNGIVLHHHVDQVRSSLRHGMAQLFGQRLEVMHLRARHAEAFCHPLEIDRRS